MKDFFISYTKVDQPWAEWIAWKLEEAGYTTAIQAWDFKPGANFVLEMQNAATMANRTIAVLSPKYLESSFTQPEWAAAIAQDPTGRKQKLMPVRIAPCELTGLLASIVYIDLVGLPEEDARAALLGALSTRKKPSSSPAFPGVTAPQPPTETSSPPVITGPSVEASRLLSRAEGSGIAESQPALSPRQRAELIQRLNALPLQQFNMLLFSADPPPGIISPMPAPQGDRSVQLLEWAKGPGGCGVTVIQDLYEIIVNPQVGPSHPTTPSAAAPSIPANVVPEHPEADRSAPVVRGSTSASAIVRLVPEDLGLTNLEIPSQPGLPPKGNPEIFVSYAWGDDSSETARKRGEVVDRLCETLANEGWNIIRDKNAMRSGDLISGFMKRIGFADHVIVVLSDKYLRSPYCMAELYGIYQRSVGEKEDLLHRIIPLPLADARFGTWRDRLVYTKYWRAEFEEMEKHFKDLGEMDFWLYKSIQEWHNRIGDMLVYLNDVLAPHVVRRFCEGRFCGLAPDVTATVLMRMLCACLLIE